MHPQILRLNKAGQALEWLAIEAAACLYAREQVIWTYGEQSFRLHGGLSRATGLRSTIDIASVIATDGQINEKDRYAPKLNNTSLFRRDGNLCLYCGQKFERLQLTCDHIIPQARGGKNVWENCVAACRACNNLKGCRTPEEAEMKLLAIPFRPNKSEYLALANRNTLADQMEFLTKGFSKHMKQR